MTDKILYVAVHPAGGVDGKDPTAKAYDVTASFNWCGNFQRYMRERPHLKLEKRVVDVDEAWGQLRAKLTPTDEALIKELGI